MANENMSIDVDEFVDSGIENAGEKLQNQLEEEGSILNPEDTGSKLVSEEQGTEQEQETQVPAKTETPEVKAKAEETETTAQADSTISQLIQNTQTDRVPVEDHVKLRQRAQKAEARVKELEGQQQQQTQPAGESAEEVDPFAELDDTDLVRVSDVKEFVGKTVNAAVGKVTQSLGQKEATARAQRFAEQAVASEQEVIKNTPDYATVTKAALKLGLISDKETVAISQSDNPAEAFYKMSKAKLTDIQTTLGITPTSTGNELPDANETPTEDDEVPDDKSILDEIYG